MDDVRTTGTEALRAAYAALNRGDIEGFLAVFDLEVERIEHFPGGGNVRGIDAVREHTIAGRSAWAEGVCEPEKFIPAGDNTVVVIANVHVRLKGRTDWIDGRIGDVFTFRNGKAIQFITFGDEQKALEFANR